MKESSIKIYIYIFIVYALSVLFLILFDGKWNAGHLLLLALIQIVVSTIINLRMGEKCKRALIISVFIFLLYVIIQNYVFFRGVRLEKLIHNSQFINRGNIEVQIIDPLKNTITTFIVCLIVHLKFGRKRNICED